MAKEGNFSPEEKGPPQCHTTKPALITQSKSHSQKGSAGSLMSNDRACTCDQKKMPVDKSDRSPWCKGHPSWGPSSGKSNSDTYETNKAAPVPPQLYLSVPRHPSIHPFIHLLLCWVQSWALYKLGKFPITEAYP